VEAAMLIGVVDVVGVVAVRVRLTEPTRLRKLQHDPLAFLVLLDRDARGDACITESTREGKRARLRGRAPPLIVGDGWSAHPSGTDVGVTVLFVADVLQRT